MSLRIFQTIAELRAALQTERAAGRSIGFVPTMGALHAGHARLIETSARACNVTVVSIFVNPTQFNDKSDFDRYPRTFEADVSLSESAGAAIIFAPSNKEMYPEPLDTHVDVDRLTQHLCGAFRPGHFRGVATVVLKLLNIVQPNRAYFGEKDAQQLAVIRRLVSDLNVPVEIVPVPTVREADGLAMSSRNRRLSTGERGVAPLLFKALSGAKKALLEGENDAQNAKKVAFSVLENALIRVEYLEIVDPRDLQPVQKIEGPVLIAIAAWLGDTRLIDNLTYTPGRPLAIS